MNKKFNFLLIFMLCLNINILNADLTQTVILQSWESVVVTWANQEQLDEWVRISTTVFTNFADAAQWLIQWANSHWEWYISINTPTSVACANWAWLTLYTPPTITTPIITSITSTQVYTPPPAPVVTSSTSGQSCSYISSRSPNWSDCSINSNWNTNWNISCSQVNNWTANVSSASWSCTTTYVDWKPSWTSCNGSCPWGATKPANQTETKILTMLLSNPITNTNNAFANNIDTNSVRVNISWTTNQNKSIIWLVWSSYANIWNIKDNSWLKANRIDNSWNNALNFSSISDSNIKWTWNSFYFDITWVKSYAPISTNAWKISFTANWVAMNLSNITYKFDKLFTSQFNTTNLKIGTTQKVELWVNKINSSNSSISWYNFSNISSSIWVNPSDKFIIENKWTEYNTNSTPAIDLRINYKWLTNISSETAPYLSIKPIITYKVNWIETKYFVSSTKDSSTNNKIDSSSAKFDSIKVTWTLQSQWKADLTGQTKNFSDLSKSTQRAEIRKNATLLTKNMTSWSTVNKVKYIVWDIAISWEQDYETLVVKDWNVKISWDLNTSWKKLWIIVLKDWYNVDNWYNWKWNIYIDKWVKYINAALYADWWVISSNSWSPYITDSDSRTNSLQTQLVIKWSIFTRNTIGWAILGTSWKYKLPWWQETTEFDKAMIYDMNYLRRWNALADSSKNLWNSNNVVIIYNPSIQTNPPKWFISN